MFIIEKSEDILLVHHFAYLKAKENFKSNCPNAFIELKVVPEDIDDYDIKDGNLILKEKELEIQNG